MRIAVTVDPYLPVPPVFYGGIERVVDFLVRGLVEQGHEVTLFAHPDSRITAKLVPYGQPPHRGWWIRCRELWQVGLPLWKARRHLDLVHSFGRLAALAPVLPLRPLPKVQSYQRAGVPWASVRHATRWSGDSIRFTGCSTSVYRGPGTPDPPAGRWITVFNGVEVDRYGFQPGVPTDAPLAFLGRLERIKGPHHAIAIARHSGRRLIIAGNRVATPEGAQFFAGEIEPHLDGQRVRYVGEVDDEAKNRLLGGCAALLMPVEWEEPFGIVMAEAMACGTPVIGFARGSLPEVIRNGLNGFVCSNQDDAVDAVKRLALVDRREVRRDCEARFGHRVIVEAYLSLYAAMRAASHDGAGDSPQS